MQILFEAPEPRRVAIDPVPEQRRSHEPKGVNERALHGPEDRSVHDRQRVGHRKRRRCDDHEDRHGERIGKRTDRSDLVGDARLMTDHQVRERERGGEQRESGTLTKETIQAMVIKAVITLLCGVGLYASLFMLNKSRRAARGEVRDPSVVKTPRAHLFGVPNSLLGSLYYPVARGRRSGSCTAPAPRSCSLLAVARCRRDLGLPRLFADLRNAAGMPVLLDLPRGQLVPFGAVLLVISSERIESGYLILLESASRVRTARTVAETAVREGRRRSVSSTLR